MAVIWTLIARVMFEQCFATEKLSEVQHDMSYFFLSFFFSTVPCFCRFKCAETQKPKITRSIGQASTPPPSHTHLFQYVKDTDYTDLPDGVSLTV